MLLLMRYVSSSLSVFCAAASSLYLNPNIGSLVNRDLPGSDKGYVTTRSLYENLTTEMNNTSSTVPTPGETGISLPCTNSSQTPPNAICRSITQEEGISPHLYNLNVPEKVPYLNSTSSSSAIVSTSAGQAAPSPTQPGISPSCTQYSQAPQGDTCATLNIAKDSGISRQQFFTWNEMLGPKGQTCDANYWAKYWYCVAINPDLVGRVSSNSTRNPNPSTMSVSTRYTPVPVILPRNHRRVSHCSKLKTGASASKKKG